MRDCTQDIWPENREWLSAFNARAARARVPVAGMIELTRRCSLRCVHCYNRSAAPAAGPEMTAEQVKHLVDEVVAAGCLYLTITGGDPMIRSDFPEIYAYARTRGLVVHVLCSGTLVTPHILDVFAQYPPSSVEITIYGSKAETHDRVTGVAGSFDVTWHSVRTLIAENVYVALKTLLMTHNIDEVPDIRSMAREVGCRHRVDPLVFPRFGDGERAPLGLRVPPEAVVACEMADERIREGWRKAYEKMKDLPSAEHLYECGAGRTCFFIDASGRMSPCLMMPYDKHDVLERGFEASWAEMAGLREKKVTAEYPCRDCGMRVLCPTCPAVNRLENGSETVPCEYACRIANLRRDMLVSEEAGVTS
ncbi:MAG: radical SAM protein [Phycisphaerae bacterium]|nr:radical SAM protein [Phycisphaerae bacterium]